MDGYARAGRGGAGNFWSKKDIEEATKGGDVESQSSTTTIKPASPPPPEYLHSGRGGAGNWIKPSDLAASGLTQTVAGNAPTSTAATKTVVGQSKPAYRGGRGGAGNYFEDPAIEEKRREEAEEKKKEEMERRVERDVELGLAKPARAYGGLNGGAYEMK